MIYGMIGVAGSGKGHRQLELVAKGAVALDFKDALIEMCEDILGFPIKDHYEFFKQVVVGMSYPPPPGGWTPEAMAVTKAISDGLLISYPHLITGRVLLQRVGTEVQRKRNPHYWCDAWEKKALDILASGKDVVCSDCRFSNEMDTIRKLGLRYVGKNVGDTYRFIFCDYKSERYNATMNHESEKMAQEYLAAGLIDGQEIPF